MKRRVVTSVFVLSLLMAVYLWFAFSRPKAEWEASGGLTIIEVVTIHGEVDYNYIPDAQVWGDGRIIWVEYDEDNSRRVLEGYLSRRDMTRLIEQFISGGFFNGLFSHWGPIDGTLVTVNLEEATRAVMLEDLSGRRHDCLAELVGSLSQGGGTVGIDLAPTEGMLLAYPIESVGWPDGAEANYHWPDDEFSYGLGLVYNIRPQTERRIMGEELVFAWEIVNSPAPLVESMGEVYWIAVRIPGVSY